MEPEVTPSPDSAMVIKLTLDAFTAEKLLVTKPRSLPAATFCALLIEQALDKPTTLAERTEGSEASTSSLSTENWTVKGTEPQRVNNSGAISRRRTTRSFGRSTCGGSHFLAFLGSDQTSQHGTASPSRSPRPSGFNFIRAAYRTPWRA